MRQFACTTISILAFVACGAACGGEQAKPAETSSEAAASSGGDEAPSASPSPTEAPAQAAPTGEAADNSEFVLQSSEKPTAGATKPPPSKLKPSHSEAVMKFFVIDKEKGPVRAVVVRLTGADGKKYYTEETTTDGYAETLVPVGQKYELAYLSLARKEVEANVTVTDEPNQNIKLTLRYKGYVPPPDAPAEPRFVLDGVNFATGKAIITPESFVRLDAVVEYMTYKKSARIEISGHTDNQGNPKANRTLSEKRAQACRDYLVSKGIEASRIQAQGFGDERPIASNDTEEGRKLNRRIEATEL